MPILQAELYDGELAGEALPSGIDPHNRAAHPGIALKNGFVHEGTLRASAWVLGAFADEVILGRLATGTGAA
ncbi:GNAT family protein [Nonomuraea composti]|uniref:GNAT family protein n=1 Tax=Nonomuraea composti TaxID=2720023 RepID=UPI003204D7A6